MADTSNNPSVVTNSVPLSDNHLTPNDDLTSRTHKTSKISWQSLFGILSTTTWAILGLFLILCGIIIKLRPFHLFLVLPSWITSPSYLISGIGLLFIAHSRNLVSAIYSQEFRKNQQFPHAWKISLISTQGFFFYVTGYYAIGVGVHFWPKIENLAALTTYFIIFLCYLLWYLISHFKNRFQTLAGFRIAFLSLALSLLAAIAISQFFFIGIVLGLLATITAVSCVTIVPFSSQEGRLWIRVLCLIGTIALLIPVVYDVIPNKNSQVNLVSLNPVVKGLIGSISDLTYSPDQTKMAFVQKADHMFLQIIDSENNTVSAFKINADNATFKPVFVDGGKSIIFDSVTNGLRNLKLFDLSNLSQKNLTENGVEKIENAACWSEDNHQFLYVSKFESGYALVSLLIPKNKKSILFSSDQPISSPAWVLGSSNIVYISGSNESSAIHTYNTSTKENRSLILLGIPHEKTALLSDKKRQDFVVLKVIPSPDGFRYLFVLKKENITSLWTVLPDGSRENKIYESRSEIGTIAWMPDSQKIIFEETGGDFSFTGSFRKIKLLNTNLLTAQNLIPPQISCWSPAPSPNGANIAFIGPQNLWYPSEGYSGVWIEAIR